MTQYRKKPVVVEAEQFTGELIYPVQSDEDGRCYVVTIHEQRAYLEDGDWVILEPKEGRAYPCKPDIFEATYELVED